MGSNAESYNTTYVYENKTNAPVNLSNASANTFINISPPTNYENVAASATTNQRAGILSAWNRANHTDSRLPNYSGNRSVIQNGLNNRGGNFDTNSRINSGVHLRHRPVTLESRSSNDAARYLPHEVSAQTDWTLPPREPFLFITTNQCELPEGGEDRMRLNSDTDTDLEQECAPVLAPQYCPSKHNSQNIYFSHTELSDSFIEATNGQVLDTSAALDDCKKEETNEDDEALDETNFNLETYIAGASTTVRGQMLNETEIIATPKHPQVVEAAGIARGYRQRPKVGKGLPGVINLTSDTASVYDEEVASPQGQENLDEDNNESIDDIYESLPEQSVEDGLRSVEDYEEITGLTPLDASAHNDLDTNEDL